MGDVKVKLNSRGVRELLRSDAVVEDLRRRGEAIADAAGPGHVVSATAGRTRARAAVVTATAEAQAAEARTRSLTSALDAGRG